AQIHFWRRAVARPEFGLSEPKPIASHRGAGAVQLPRGGRAAHPPARLPATAGGATRRPAQLRTLHLAGTGSAVDETLECPHPGLAGGSVESAIETPGADRRVVDRDEPGPGATVRIVGLADQFSADPSRSEAARASWPGVGRSSEQLASGSGAGVSASLDVGGRGL